MIKKVSYIVLVSVVVLLSNIVSFALSPLEDLDPGYNNLNSLGRTNSQNNEFTFLRTNYYFDNDSITRYKSESDINIYNAVSDEWVPIVTLEEVRAHFSRQDILLKIGTDVIDDDKCIIAIRAEEADTTIDGLYLYNRSEKSYERLLTCRTGVVPPNQYDGAVYTFIEKEDKWHLIRYDIQTGEVIDYKQFVENSVRAMSVDQDYIYSVYSGKSKSSYVTVYRHPLKQNYEGKAEEFIQIDLAPFFFSGRPYANLKNIIVTDRYMWLNLTYAHTSYNDETGEHLISRDVIARINMADKSIEYFRTGMRGSEYGCNIRSLNARMSDGYFISVDYDLKLYKKLGELGPYGATMEKPGILYRITEAGELIALGETYGCEIFFTDEDIWYVKEAAIEGDMVRYNFGAIPAPYAAAVNP